MKNICFIANYSKTYLFHAIAEELQEKQVGIYWICTNRELYKFLRTHYKQQQILLINMDHLAKDSLPLHPFKINELVYGDRVLRNEPEKGIRFLNNIQQDIYTFLQQRSIHFVFGEITWAHEILIHRICSRCQELNCRFLNPHVVRLPNHRFAFFTDENQSKFFDLSREPRSDHGMIQLKPPAYLKINDKIQAKARSLSGRLDRIRRFFTNENIDKKDPTQITNESIRFKIRSREELYKETYRLVKKVSYDDFKGQPYIFIGLHKQPEASIDVIGRYYEDQLTNIQNIWRVLPYNWKLVVKEHTNAIGDRSLDFYRKLQRWPNLILVDEKTPSYELIKNARAVVSVSGTICYEAALLRVPAFTFAPTFFNRLNGCDQLHLHMLQDCEHFEQLIWKLEASFDNRMEFSNYLMNHSFEGTFTDPITIPAVLEPENVQKLSIAFNEIINCSLVKMATS